MAQRTTWRGGSLGGTERRSIAAAAFFGFGTLALFYSRSFYADPLLTLIVTLIFIAIFDDEPKAWAVLILCSLVIPAEPVGVFACGLAFLYLAYHRKRNAAIAAMIGTGFGCLSFAFYDWIRFENVFKSGQRNFWGVHEMALGFAGLLCGPGVGILIASPLLLTILSCKLDEKARWILGLAASYLVLYSCWQRWWSSDWGPRFLMPILPALIALSVFTKHRRLWLALACFSFALQIPTPFAAPERQFSILRSEGIPPQVAVWSFSRSSTFGMWPSAMAQVQAAQSTDVRAFSQFRQSASSFDDARNFRIVTIWWWMLPPVHIPRIVGAVISLIELLVGLWIVAKLWQQAMPAPPTQRDTGSRSYS
ncbi:MAG TPA: hypothetical protein VK795_05830 [Terriglobales bacterium]|nr:hypothetical protein [Terriglobales bacterium]